MVAARGMAATVLASATSLLLLTGCVPTREVPEPGLSDEEVRAYFEVSTGYLWQSTGLDDSLRPEIDQYAIIDNAAWAVSLVRCMNERGYADYVATDDGGVSWSGALDTSTAESIDWFECQSIHQADPRLYGAIGVAALDYLYDYNVSVLVPCLKAHGVELALVPTREEAATIGGQYQAWNPYFWTRERFNPEANAVDRNVLDSCDPYPPGEIWNDYRLPL